MIVSRFLCASLVLGLCAAPALQATPVRADGYTHVRSLGGIDEYRLDANGLTVLLLPSHAAPVVTYQVTYKVGSRNEVTGSTGGTHLLEHLMFKGSKHFSKEQGNSIDIYLERVGAGFNASTAQDRTNYYATLGPDALPGYIAIEGDRMHDLLLRESDRKDEMTVVRNEYEQNENDPNSVLGKLIWAAAYEAHPYHHPVIGWRSDIEGVSIEKLRTFYNTYYWPNNATVTVVGDIDPVNVLGLIRKSYGKIPHSPEAIPTVYTTEPVQQGARRVMLERAGDTGSVSINWKSPSALDPDMPALSMLKLVLKQGKSSRLSRALVDTSLASYVDASASMLHDPGLFGVDALLNPGVTHEKVEQVMLDVVDKVKRDGVTTEEMHRVLGPYRADVAYRRDGTDSAAGALNEYIAMGDWTMYVNYLDKLEKVTPADVQRVAKKYLNKNQSTTGWFVPEASK